jgi:hypothetical protein
MLLPDLKIDDEIIDCNIDICVLIAFKPARESMI